MPSYPNERSQLVSSPETQHYQTIQEPANPNQPASRHSHFFFKPSLPFYHAQYRKFPTRQRTLFTIISIILAAAAVYLYNLYTHRDLVDQLAHSIENLSTCASCQALLIPLISIAHLGDSKLFSTLVSFCTGLGIQDPEVCRGALGAQAPILAHSLRSMSLGGPASVLFCAKTFGLCDDPPVRDWSDMPLPPPSLSHLLTTNLTLQKEQPSLRSPPAHPRLPPRSSSPTSSTNTKREPLQVIHISDLHIDREYTIGADAKCARNLCCRLNQPSDLFNKTQIPAGPYGHHNCDSPESLYISMLRALRNHAPNASFAMHTGDMVDHAVWTSVRKEVEDGIQQGHSQYHTYSDVPLYGVIGNHDVAPTNSFPRNTTITTLSSQWDIELFSDTWARWIGNEGTQALQETSGCYSRVHPGTNLKIISLNTGFWYKANFWLYDSDDFQPDPNGILAWLIGELQDAENRGQKAWIIGHLSPGKADCLHEPSRYINQILRRYKHTIAAMFYGHTHRSEWEIVYEDPQHPTAENAVGIIYIGPAVTPESGNPAFRVYDVDPETYQVLDFHEIIANLSSPTFQSHPEWFEYYSARATYGKMLEENGVERFLDQPSSSPLDGSFWHKVTEILEDSYPEFEKFFHRLTRGAEQPSDWKPCYSGECRKKWVHNLRSSQSEYNEYPNQVGLHIDTIDNDNSSFPSSSLNHSSDPSHRSKRNPFNLLPDEEDGEHVCGDLASLYRHAKNHLPGLKTKKLLVPDKLKQEIRSNLRQP
ncbi:hypothetical protein PGT21_026556 [Puccinia graminis f. sp. tritici]|uniref:Calcineurin-like phosphoesterase domain-containing protein n=1 Tax=Puccinia graminis f. sp. tritici TaxID=56615 RepID=A0A5B0Q6R6_PUCGR|nr:hypothetical protein PGT21_026556 [Puccinia graminis f. sp. tritici]